MAEPLHRPLPDEAPDPRERLLDAAERVFADRGFRAGSVREITQAAQCNVAAVNYYFGSKADLYREVFLRRLTALREQRVESIRRTLERAGEAATLELLLEAFTSAFVAPLVERSTGRMWMKLLSREMLDPQLPRDLFVSEMIRPVEEALVEAFQRVCPELRRQAAQLCGHSLVAQLTHVTNLQRCLTDDGAQPLPAGYELSALVRHVVLFSAAGIRALAVNDPQEDDH